MGEDFKQLFQVGYQQGLRGINVFTDRENQYNLFKERHERWRSAIAGVDPQDMGAPRRNILHFYGVGGVGKSTFLRELCGHMAGQHVSHWSVPTSNEKVVTAYIDFSRTEGTNLEDAVLTIRAACTNLGRPIPAFDILLSRYWEIVHPGEDLDAYLRRRGLASRAAEAIGLSDQVLSAISEVANELGQSGGLVVGGVRSAKALVGALYGRSVKNLRIDKCERFGPALEADPTQDYLTFLPHFLSWELSRNSDRGGSYPNLVIFIDTLEDAGSESFREIERHIQRLIWLMPNVFFVTAGRNRLRWDDESLIGQLDFVGTQSWPTLSIGDSDQLGQVLIGDLADQDCRDYLRHRVTLSGKPAISQSIEDVIVEKSGGLPYFLDICAMHFLQLVTSGRTPKAEDFEVGFQAIVARIFRDLLPDERHALRFASLLDGFDIDLLHEVGATKTSGPLEILVKRPFVKSHDSGGWSFSLHKLVRDAIRNSIDSLEDSWGARDWILASEKIASELVKRCKFASHRADFLFYFSQILVLIVKENIAVESDVLELSELYVEPQTWEPLALEIEKNIDLASGADRFVIAMHLISSRQRMNRKTFQQQLEPHLEGLPDRARPFVEYFYAEALRDTGRLAEALTRFESASKLESRQESSLRGKCHILRRMGLFNDAYEIADSMSPSSGWMRVKGDLLWTNGKFGEAALQYKSAQEYAIANRQPGEVFTNVVSEAFTLAFVEPDIARELINRAITQSEIVRQSWTETLTLVASAICSAGTESFRDDLLSANQKASEYGLSSVLGYIAIAEALHTARSGIGDRQDVSFRAREISSIGGLAYVPVIADLLLFRNVDDQIAVDECQWMDGWNKVSTRWLRIVDRNS